MELSTFQQRLIAEEICNKNQQTEIEQQQTKLTS